MSLKLIMLDKLLTLASIIENNNNNSYLAYNRKSALFAWLVLTLAIILGGRWAYLELGWGGYWAWDPVENASLMPWLVATAYLHSIIVEQKKGYWLIGTPCSCFTIIANRVTASKTV